MAAEVTPASTLRSRRWERWGWKPTHWWRVPLAVQWLALFAFNIYEYNRFALTHDFALYWQALWLMAHGHLNPYSTVAGYPFLDNHLELIMYLLVPFVWIVPSALVLLWIQSTALIGAEWIAWTWITSWANGQRDDWRPWLRATGIVLLVANPWIYWAAAFDFHPESLMALTIMGAAYALWRKDNRRLLIWTGITLLAGDVACLLVVGLGLTGILIRRWRTATVLLVAGLGWLLMIGALGADKGAVLAPSYGYLAPGVAHLTVPGLVIHILGRPQPAVRMLWARRMNLFANLSPSGLVGLATPWGIGAALTSLVPSSLTSGLVFGEPGFQNAPTMGLVTIGSVMVIGWIGARFRNRVVVPLLASVFVANTLGWAAVWVPRVPTTWVRVAALPSHTLYTIQAMIPPTATIIAPQAVIGRFADRSNIYAMIGHTKFLLTPNRPTYVISAPYQGIHKANMALMASQLLDLADASRATLAYEHHGVYLWKILGDKTLILPARPVLPAWAFQSQIGKRVVGSPPKDWYVAGLGHNGNVIDGAYWREPDGTYRVAVSLSGWGPAQIQVWDASTGYLVANRYVTLSNGHKVNDSYTFVFNTAKPSRPYAGWGPWSTKPIPGPKNNQLEVRVYAQASGMVNVYTVSLNPYSP